MSEKPLSPFKWVATDGQVKLRALDGSCVDVAAKEIFSAAFRSLTQVGGYEVGNPIADLPELSFSRVPAEPALLLSGTSTASMRWEFGVANGETFASLPAVSDQAILEGRWYPVDAAGVHAARDSLPMRSSADSGELTLGQLISLRQSNDSDIRIFDRIDASLGADHLAPLDASGIAAKLYPYQELGAAFLGMISGQSLGCLLADEMGLGKTLQVIALLDDERRSKRTPSLVVAPSTLVENWRRELNLFAPHIHVLRHMGAERAGVAEILLAFDVVVTSYDIMVRDEHMMRAISWNVVALDEAQNIKNPEAQRTLSSKRLKRRVSIAITGTPVENRLEDLWSITDFCLPALLGDLRSFRDKYTDNSIDAKRLGTIVAPTVLRRRIADVATELPTLIQIPQPLQMAEELAMSYEAIRQQALGAGAGAQLAAIAHLRQLCAHSFTNADPLLQPLVESPKYERFTEILDEIFSRSQKVLVFGSFHELIDALLHNAQQAWPMGIFDSIDGRTKVDQRQVTVDRFSVSKSYGALFLNPKAAGVGLNITAANHVIHFTPEWNPAVTAQASARAYRRRQTLPVTVHHLYYENTIEEAIMNRASFKRELADEAVISSDGEIVASEILEALRRSPIQTAS
jgi:SNF2 family DNA or RNA helicase